MLKTAKPCWIVINPHPAAGIFPNRHESYGDAVKFARQLALEEPDQQFHVMACVRVLQKSEHSNEVHDNDPTCPYIDVPF